MRVRTRALAGAAIVLALAALPAPAEAAQQAKFIGSDSVNGDKFGFSVAVAGSTAVVGAIYHDVGAGEVYVFHRTAATWSQVAEFQGGDTAHGDSFGRAVATNGSTIVVGAPDHGGGGAAYVFQGSLGTWTQRFEVTGNSVGTSVAISNGTIAIGAVNNHTSDGAVYLYKFINQTWVHEQTLTSRVAGDDFGGSVAISGNELAVGATFGGEKVGHVYAYHWTGIKWVLQARFAPAGTKYGDNFGASVAMDSDALIVGAPMPSDGPGALYAYVLKAGVWTEQAKLAAAGGKTGDALGWSVGISGTRAIGGANLAGDHGAAYVFVRSGGVWKQTAMLVGSDTAATDAFASSVGQSGTTSVVGACNKHDDRGEVYVFVA